jgi:hypothetical protein
MKDVSQLVFTKTRILAVKVATLVTFLAMVKTLDQVNFSHITHLDMATALTAEADKLDTETCSAAFKNTNQRTCGHGQFFWINAPSAS